MSPGHEAVDLPGMDPLALTARCAQDRDSPLWSEFLRRFAPRIRFFIRSTLRQIELRSAQEEEDLFQSTIVRLIENDCAALRKFSGSNETELITYLAVISRSVVHDYRRLVNAKKRPPSLMLKFHMPHGGPESIRSSVTSNAEVAERRILVRELNEIGLDVVRNLSCQFPARDKLIFELYFFDNLSIPQIARCEGIGLSETRIKTLLHRMEELIRNAATQGPSEAVLR